ncbi:16S rRNA (uracil(1498)-N(3))-methyltransferase [Candidatus Babeliales bacterium]|nr:16S rRNA (uracil(1498)-N(3))-methyltransferase [Candidatus Babeliales bacterium]MCF7899208.1 16S rRNA (uracil(1498)-N(3))-methyltransferase [Candidatus Babeliales bacterium]
MLLEKHIFAIYLNNLSELNNLNPEETLLLQNKEINQRIIKILRLDIGEQIILFDSKTNLELEILQTKQNKVFGKILKIQDNKKITPEIMLAVGLLKKNSFEEILYVAAQMGVTQIQPILSEKIQKNWFLEKDLNRLNKILISACEQSKNFVVPELLEPVKLDKFLHNNLNNNIEKYKKICFEPDSQKLLKLLQDCNKNPENLILLFGPEGGFSNQELDLIKTNKFEFYTLTPTILRSVEAITVGLGAVRSIF